MYQKNLVSGEFGSVDAKIENGEVTLSASVEASLGGGQAAGVVKVKSTNSIVIEDAQLVTLALEYLKTKLPEAAQGAITALEAVAIPALKNA